MGRYNENSEKSFFQEFEESHIDLATEDYSKASFGMAVMLINYRNEHDYSQRDLGKFLHISQPMVSKMESGDYNFTFEQASKIAVALGKRLSFKEDVDAISLIISKTIEAIYPKAMTAYEGLVAKPIQTWRLNMASRWSSDVPYRVVECQEENCYSRSA
jgi:DNA-binding XRE family transcriptional regulator